MLGTRKNISCEPNNGTFRWFSFSILGWILGEPACEFPGCCLKRQLFWFVGNSEGFLQMTFLGPKNLFLASEIDVFWNMFPNNHPFCKGFQKSHVFLFGDVHITCIWLWTNGLWINLDRCWRRRMWVPRPIYQENLLNASTRKSMTLRMLTCWRGFPEPFHHQLGVTNWQFGQCNLPKIIWRIQFQFGFVIRLFEE